MLCGGSVRAQSRDTFYVAKVAWHTNLVIKANTISDSLWPDSFNPENNRWLEIGWGDSEYYPSEKFKADYLLKAVLLPTRSALLVNAVRPPLQKRFVADKVIRVIISHQKLNSLITYIKNSFATGNKNSFIPIQEGPYPNSCFFLGKERYYFPKTCNTWAAGGLQSAGYSLWPVLYQRPGKVIKKASGPGKLIMKR